MSYGPQFSSSLPFVTPIDVFEKKQYSAPPQNKLFTFLNKFGCYYFYFLTSSLYIVIIALSPEVYKEYSTQIVYFTSYVVVNIVANYYLTWTRKPYYKPVEEAQLPSNSWTFCSYCQILQPPRCHHCPLCHHCILKRDHHCFFTGICVGERNQGHFAMYCLHCSIGLSIGTAILYNYLTSNYYEVFSLDFYHYFPPITLLSVIFGNTSALTFFYVFLLCGSAFTALFCFFLFVMEIFLIACDTTSHEVSVAWEKRILWSTLWHVKPIYNLRKTFGTFWILNFVLPLPNQSLSTTLLTLSKQF